MTKKILFICHGNICRSPMAEFITKKIVKDLGKENEYEIFMLLDLIKPVFYNC